MTTIAELLPPGEDELFAVVGPTASGKSELALRLCERFDGEVVGTDSVQLYRYFDIGSGKPNAEERARATHHLVDAFDPLDHFDAARFVEHADAAIADIHARGRKPILCGGTFLWMKALLFGLAPSAPADQKLRVRHQQLAEAEGRAALHAELARVDPPSAVRLAPNDLVRVSRALEVYELTGKTQTEWHEAHQFRSQRYSARLLGVERSREELDRRIEKRSEAWLAGGWADEVASLIERGYGDARAMHSVGYKQVHAFVTGTLPEAELRGAIIRATRTFVRRQRTWLRDQPVALVSC